MGEHNCKCCQAIELAIYAIVLVVALWLALVIASTAARAYGRYTDAECTRWRGYLESILLVPPENRVNLADNALDWRRNGNLTEDSYQLFIAALNFYEHDKDQPAAIIRRNAESVCPDKSI